jgi:hypothetical protein
VVPTTTPPIATLQPSAAAATTPPQRPHSGAHHSGTTQTRGSRWSSVGLCKLRTDGLAAPRAKLGTTLTLALRLPMSTTKRKKDLLAHNDTPFEAEDEGESSRPHRKTQKVAYSSTEDLTQAIDLSSRDSTTTAGEQSKPSSTTIAATALPRIIVSGENEKSIWAQKGTKAYKSVWRGILRALPQERTARAGSCCEARASGP